MTAGDHQLLAVAHAGAPQRGVRVTGARGVCRVPGGPWHRFEGPSTLAGFVGDLDDQAVTVYRQDACVKVLLGDVLEVREDVSYRELISPLTLDEALTFASFDLATHVVQSEVPA